MKKFTTLIKEFELYALRTRKDTEEKHLFITKKDGDKCVPVGRDSICKKMTHSDASSTSFSCVNAEKARETCAKLGSSVCGTCVSHLYADYL